MQGWNTLAIMITRMEDAGIIPRWEAVPVKLMEVRSMRSRSALTTTVTGCWQRGTLEDVPLPAVVVERRVIRIRGGERYSGRGRDGVAVRPALRAWPRR
jgi:hypothetical protein